MVGRPEALVIFQHHEIQAGNPHSLPAVERLRDAVDRLLAAVRERRGERFAELMAEGRRRTRAERAPNGDAPAD